MEDSSLDLAGIIKLGRTVEVVSKQIQEMRKSQGRRLPDVEASVHQLKHIRVSKTRDNNYEPSNKECFNCGGTYPHEGQCPALGKTCNFCKGLNHYAKCCKSKSKHSNTNRSQRGTKIAQTQSTDPNTQKLNMINDFLVNYDDQSKHSTNSHVWALGNSQNPDFSYVPLNINNSKIQFTTDTAS